MEEKKTQKTANAVAETKNVLYVERENFKGNDGKDYWAYIVRGNIRGREVKVDFTPKDKGGYEPLDIVFDVSPKAELIMSEEKMVDSTTGKVTKFTSYKVLTVDEDGIPYECSIKRSIDSDKALLKMLMNSINVKNNK